MSSSTASMVKQSTQTALGVTRADDYAAWYQQVVRAADIAELSSVRGCMVLKAWGYGAWEMMRNDLDRRFRETGHENYYFPLFIPLSYFQREAEHVDGFAKEMAIVTHHRLANKDGQLVPDGELEEPLVIRPTSETIIGESMAKWIKSYRDLPLLLNQWANVVRWEMRPRILLRTTEFLWQEGHTAHETLDDAMFETRQMIEAYRQFAEECLALPVIVGEKPPHERFPGAVNTFCIEAMMQDGRALQAGTSHYLGQNFARSCNIRFQGRSGELEYVHTTSWGVSTRLLGAIVMAHADDDGMRMPPRVAAQQVVICPIMRAGEDSAATLEYCAALKVELEATTFAGSSLRVKLDNRDLAGGDKRWEWIRKGVPLLLEIGPRDVKGGQVCVTRRDRLSEGKKFIVKSEFIASVAALLQDIQQTLFKQALAFRAERMVTDIKDRAAFEAYFAKTGDNGFSGGQGFVRALWSGDAESLAILEALGVTVRCLPLDQDGRGGACVLTGKPAQSEAIFARAY